MTWWQWWWIGFVLGLGGAASLWWLTERCALTPSMVLWG